MKMSQKKISHKKISHKKTDIYRQGILVAIILAILTVVEYFVAITIDSYILLTVLAVAKGGMVLYYFMHISNLWSAEGEH